MTLDKILLIKVSRTMQILKLNNILMRKLLTWRQHWMLLRYVWLRFWLLIWGVWSRIYWCSFGFDISD